MKKGEIREPAEKVCLICQGKNGKLVRHKKGYAHQSCITREEELGR